MHNNYYSKVQVIGPKNYCKINVVKLSENRFILIYDKGFEIFSLNKNKKYFSEIFIHNSDNLNIQKICEANKNELIICANKRDVVIKNINNKQRPPIYNIRTSLKNIDSRLFLFIECNSPGNNNSMLFSDGIVLKEKYFIIMVDNNLLIISLLQGKIIKNYSIVCFYDNDFIIYKSLEIIKWDATNDDEFLLNLNGNITLFELKEENLQISLNILAYYYFPNIKGIRKYKAKNKFYLKKDKSICFY